MTYAVLAYDPEAVCGSFDASFNIFGPFETREDAEMACAAIELTNGPGAEVLPLSAYEED